MSTRCNRIGRSGHRALYGTHMWPETESSTRKSQVPRWWYLFGGGQRIKLCRSCLTLFRGRACERIRRRPPPRTGLWPRSPSATSPATEQRCEPKPQSQRFPGGSGDRHPNQPHPPPPLPPQPPSPGGQPARHRTQNIAVRPVCRQSRAWCMVGGAGIIHLCPSNLKFVELYRPRRVGDVPEHTHCPVVPRIPSCGSAGYPISSGRMPSQTQRGGDRHTLQGHEDGREGSLGVLYLRQVRLLKEPRFCPWAVWLPRPYPRNQKPQSGAEGDVQRVMTCRHGPDRGS